MWKQYIINGHLMGTYIFKKFLLLFSTLFFVITVTFILMKIIPGDPFSQEDALPHEIRKSLFAHYGLDKPLHVQYIKYLKGIVTWNLGPSFKYEGRTVNDILRDSFPISALLGTIALITALVWGILWGSIAAFYRGKWQDTLSMTIAVLGMSLPAAILAAFLQYLFAIKWGFFPIARIGTIKHLILPAISLSAFPSAFIALLTRSSMVETLQKDFIITARAKGLSNFEIWKNHVLKNSLLPIVAYTGTLFAKIVTGSFIIEKIFGIPGLGCWFVNSVINRDYTIILGLTIFYNIILLLAIFVVDVLYLFLDPRIKRPYQAHERPL